MFMRCISVSIVVVTASVGLSVSRAQLVITSVFDGPGPFGPSGIELHVLNDVPQLSQLSLGVAEDGSGTAGREFTFPSISARAGEFLYVTSNADSFEQFFGFEADFTTEVMAIDGNDAIELYSDDVWAKNIPIDVFGDAFRNGRGTPWEYTQGWATRSSRQTARSGFLLSQWDVRPGVFDGTEGMTNATAAEPLPLGTYVPPAPRQIFPGDADQDLDFDQLDLVKVQVAGKYLTGQPATWGDGDWDGGPGLQGNPSVGNGLFDQQDIIASLATGTYLTVCYAALSPDGRQGDDQTSLVYDADTGEVLIDAPQAQLLSWIALSSSAQIFDNEPGINLEGRMDSDTDGYIFKKAFEGGFGSISLGKIAQPGLTQEEFLRDLSAIVSLHGSNNEFNGIDLVYFAAVPEPKGSVLVVVGYGCLFGRRPNRRSFRSAAKRFTGNG